MSRRQAFWRLGSGVVLGLLASVGFKSDVNAQSQKGCVAKCCVEQCHALAAGHGRDLGACISDCHKDVAGTNGAQARAICELVCGEG